MHRCWPIHCTASLLALHRCISGSGDLYNSTTKCIDFSDKVTHFMGM